jgi:hypothetical protein
MNELAWSAGGIILTGENPKYSEMNLCSVPLYCACLIWQTDCELTPRRKSILRKLAACLLVKIFFHFYGSRNFFTVLAKAPHWPLSRTKRTTTEILPNLVKIRFSKLLLLRPNHFKFSVPYSFLNRNFCGFLACDLKSANHESTQQAVFHTVLSLPAVGLHLFSSAAYSATPAVRFLSIK